jgi:plasmid replication initiation protein
MAKKSQKGKTNKGIVLIKKSNNLIESRYKFDIWETRVFLSVLAQIRRSDDDFQVYRIWYKDVIKTFGLKSGDSYSLLRQAAQSLMGKSFFVSYDNEGVMREKQYHILREIDYLKKGQEGKATENNEYIDVTVEQKMKPLLLQLQKNFTAYDLRNIVKLGVYPVRIYELLKQYQSIGKRKLEVEGMKRMFGILDQYKLFGDFFRWIVKPAIKEINKHTDITITNVEKIKEGRRVTALKFFFHPKQAEELRKVHGETVQAKLDFDGPKVAQIAENELIEVEMTDKDLLFNEFQKDVVQRFGVTPSVFLKLLDKYSQEEVAQAVRVTNRANYQQQIKTNIAGFFILALKNGYTDPKEEAQKKKLKAKETTLQKQRIAAKKESLEVEKTQQVNDKIREMVTANPELTNKAIAKIAKSQLAKVIIKEKEKELGRPLEIEDYRQDRTLREFVKNTIVEMQMKQFLGIFEKYEADLEKLNNVIFK